MSPELEQLIKLQQLETAIEEARRTVADHPQRLASADARLQEATDALESAKHRLKEGQEARRALEKDAAVYQGRLSKFKDQLSAVKTNREYQAMQKEIEVATEELRAVEDKVLERMLDGDALAAEVKRAEAALAAQRKEVEAEKQALDRELAETERRLTSAVESRDALVRAMEPRLVALFEQLARARKGVGICTATYDGLCSVCHVRLRPQVFQQVRHNDSVIQCESCRRILYWVPPPVQPTPPTVVP